MSASWLRWVGLSALGAFAFVVGVFVTLPMGLVARIVEAQAEKATGFQYDVTVERARLAFGGVKLIGVEVAERPVVGTLISEPLAFDSVKATVSPLSALGGLRATVELRSGEGRLRAQVRPADEGGRAVQLDFFAFELGNLAALRAKIGLPLTGAMSGTIMLDYSTENRLRGGNVEVGIESLTLGPGEFRSAAFRQFGGSVPLPLTRFGNLIVRAPIEASSVQVTEFRAEGADVRIDASGEIELRNPMVTSRVNLSVQLGVDGNYVETAGLGAALALPDVQRLQTGDGFALSLSGPLGRPSVTPGTRGRGPR